METSEPVWWRMETRLRVWSGSVRDLKRVKDEQGRSIGVKNCSRKWGQQVLSTVGAGVEPRQEVSMTNGHWIQSSVPVKVLTEPGIITDFWTTHLIGANAVRNTAIKNDFAALKRGDLLISPSSHSPRGDWEKRRRHHETSPTLWEDRLRLNSNAGKCSIFLKL